MIKSVKDDKSIEILDKLIKVCLFVGLLTIVYFFFAMRKAITVTPEIQELWNKGLGPDMEEKHIASFGNVIYTLICLGFAGILYVVKVIFVKIEEED